jgi:hypothetical protein
VRVYCVTTIEQAERIAIEGFHDVHHGVRSCGVIVHLQPPCVNVRGLTVIDILIGDESLEPYLDGDIACVPARILNAGYAELID